ncbi:TMEM143 family protein [Pseudoalteromonas ulvae]|nr:TMEM143 family protein [Pseudoalteromonas ulvae]
MINQLATMIKPVNAPENYIPLTKVDIKSLCQESLPAECHAEFSAFCLLLEHTLHYEHYQLLNTLKENYAPFDPNKDTLDLQQLTDEQRDVAQTHFNHAFTQVLNKANFEQITADDLAQALNEESLFKVRLEVNFDDFAHVVFYRRGEQQKTETIRSWWGLRKQTIQFTNYDRVAVYIQFKDAAYFAKTKRTLLGFEPGATIIKLFQNVPKADLEMLFPNSQVRMRPIDKLVIGGSAIIGGAVVLITKLGASLLLLFALFSYWFGLSDQPVTLNQQQLIALGIGCAIFGSFIFKEWSKFKNRKIKFMKALADNLYVKNLDNNAGVFHHLLDNAQDEEFKEALLAYSVLVKANRSMTAQEIDQSIEDWLKQKTGVDIDFEIDDALHKLTRLSLIVQQSEHFYAHPLSEANRILDTQWDKVFEF